MCLILDPRVKDWLLMSSPFTIIGVITVYLFFVLKLGPILMKNRKPFNIDQVVKYYNLLQVLLCAGIFYQVFSKTYFWVMTNDFFVGISLLLWTRLQHIMRANELFYAGLIKDCSFNPLLFSYKSHRSVRHSFLCYEKETKPNIIFARLSSCR